MTGLELLRALISSQVLDAQNWPALSLDEKIDEDGDINVNLMETHAYNYGDDGSYHIERRPAEVGFVFTKEGIFKGVYNWKE